MRCSAADEVGVVFVVLVVLACTSFACAQETLPTIAPDALAELGPETSETAPAAADASTEPEAAPEVPPEVHVPGPGEWLPASTSQLYGQWAASQDGKVRALKFAQLDNLAPDLVGVTPVYFLYVYPAGQPPQQVQRGRYKLTTGPTLVLEPTWDADNPRGGPAIEWPLLVAPLQQLALQTPAGVRAYEKVSQLP